MHSFCGKVNHLSSRARGIESRLRTIFFDFFPFPKKVKNRTFGVEIADECVVSGEPPHCRKTDARARKRCINVCCACQRAAAACSAASARSSTHAQGCSSAQTLAQVIVLVYVCVCECVCVMYYIHISDV